MRAKPLFAFTLVASALALPDAAHALALGRLTVHSALGQPLSAQIELASATREELESLTARVADPAQYRSSNLTYQGVLSRARVTVERGTDGRPILRITSPTPVNEPYLDLMVDVNWANGRVVREYTFLLDPPGTSQTMIAADPAPARGAATTAAAPARPAPVASAAPAASVAPSVAPADGYTVRRGDTLSKIAAQYKPPEVTLEQMLVALFNANPNAFDGNNMNRLRSGAIVTVPSADAAQSIATTEATRTVRVQAADWRSYRDRLAGAAPSVEGGSARSAGGSISAAVQDRAGAAPAGRDQVRVSREAGAGAAAGATEDSVARNKQLAEANARIADLEKSLRDLQRATEIRNQTMAQAQASAEATKGKAPAPAAKGATPATTPAPAPAAITPPPAPVPAPAVIPPIATAPAEPAKAVEPPKAVTPPAEPPKAVEPAPTTSAPISTPAPAPEAKAPEAPVPAAVPAPAPKPAAKAPPPPPQPSFLEDLMANTPAWAIGAGALAILGGLAWLVAMRRRKTTKFEDSIISGTDIKTNTVFGSTGGGVVNTGENSLASDFSREGLGSIDTDEVDPIAEAEVYLAYGRDAQAEEILKDALKKDPQRQEIYLKLLEIHAQHNKPSAFETVASELYSVSQGQGETWQKAVALGRQLDPNNPMFAEGGAPPAGVPRAAPLPMDGFSVSPSIAPAVAAKPKDDVLDFQLDDDITVSPTASTPAGMRDLGETTIQKAGDAMRDLALGGADKAKTAAAASAAALTGTLASAKAATTPAMNHLEQKVEAVRREVADKLDLDFSLDDDEKPAAFGKREPVPAGHDDLGEASTLGGSSLTRPAAAIELDKLDLGFDPDRATFEDPTPSVLDGQWHDAATKLDLAKAYQEMGDVEGAREILQEVLHEGDDQQKVEAQGLLSKLG